MAGVDDFFERVAARVRETGACLVVGLDPRAEEMTADERAGLATDPEVALIAHARRLFAATSDLAAAWKPNLAFYEAHGPAGWAALQVIVPMLQAAAPVILDGKRGDIGSTAKAYATALYDRLGGDAVTVNAWMGEDALTPFLRPGKGAFVLVRTSNPGAAEVQDVDVGGEPLWSRLVAASDAWYSKQSATRAYVVGATAPEVLLGVRALARDAWILAPGVGAQGADLTAVMRARRADGLGLLVPVSRAISGAADPRAAALAIVTAMRALGSEEPAAKSERSETAAKSERAPILVALADALFDRGFVRFGDFTLKSGARSPIYLDLRRLVSHPDVMRLAAKAYVAAARGLHFDRLAALPYAALPIGQAVALEAGWPMIYPRREAKDYGTQVAIEGEYAAGEVVLVLDDVATRGDSKLEAFTRLEAAGLRIEDVLVLIDREGGARRIVEAAGKRFHAVFTLGVLLDRWQASGRLDAARADAVRAFLAETRDSGGG